MGIRSFFESASKLLRSASKPDWKTLWTSIKICVAGVAIVGGIGFLVRIISATIQGTS
ncbi:preprotein translocase subunit SecE [Candidatus Bathyarchaeota archaeon]|nr:preprotein translocase subunit SecE [Candidatus Bathyarchaeota archaeon]